MAQKKKGGGSVGEREWKPGDSVTLPDFPEDSYPASAKPLAGPTVTVLCNTAVTVREGNVFDRKFEEGEHSVARTDFERYLKKTGHFEIVE
jgi:hypothetical protein